MDRWVDGSIDESTDVPVSERVSECQGRWTEEVLVDGQRDNNDDEDDDGVGDAVRWLPRRSRIISCCSTMASEQQQQQQQQQQQHQQGWWGIWDTVKATVRSTAQQQQWRCSHVSDISCSSMDVTCASNLDIHRAVARLCISVYVSPVVQDRRDIRRGSQRVLELAQERHQGGDRHRQAGRHRAAQPRRVRDGRRRCAQRHTITDLVHR